MRIEESSLSLFLILQSSLGPFTTTGLSNTPMLLSKNLDFCRHGRLRRENRSESISDISRNFPRLQISVVVLHMSAKRRSRCGKNRTPHGMRTAMIVPSLQAMFILKEVIIFDTVCTRILMQSVVPARL